jgi:2-keto-4-pentenoate hydratase
MDAYQVLKRQKLTIKGQKSEVDCFSPISEHPANPVVWQGGF